MVQEVLLYVSLIIGLAAILTIIAKAIKQPPIIAYLISGVLVGPLFFGLISQGAPNIELIQIFAHIGVAFLLFIVGLSLDLRVLKEVGGVSTIAGLGGIAITTLIGFFISIGLGFESLTALYLAFAMAFSSTVVVVKILSDKNEMDTLHGRIALGILIVQDFVAAAALMIFPVIKTGDVTTIFFQLGKIIALIAAIFLFSNYILRWVLHYLARSQEVLFLSGIAWALVISTLFNQLGLSLEIGALIAGMSLASSKYTLELGGKIKPLRDFFIILFFIYFGSQLAPPIGMGLLIAAGVLSVFVMLGKPLILMIFIRFFGYKKRTNFLTSSSLAQISEFSLILILLGFTLGHISQEVMSLAVLIALITIGLSTYLTHHSNKIFSSISGMLGLFEGNSREIEIIPNQQYDVVLFGYNRTGYSLLKTLKKLKLNFLVVDYNPRVILKLSKKKINCVYGDASDKEFINDIGLQDAKLVISTIQDMDSNKTIMKRLDEIDSKAIFMATSDHLEEALLLYKEGADYVITPHILGGEYASELINKNKTQPGKYKKTRKDHIKELKERLND